jgi:hypothetical protein
MELGHLFTRSGLTYPEVSSKIYRDSFCQLGSSISLPWVIYFEAFYLHFVSSFSCIPVICPKLVLFLTPLQFVHLFCNLSQVYPAVLLMYFISAAVFDFIPAHARTMHIIRISTGGPHYASSTTGTGASFLVVKEQGHGTDCTPLSSTEVKNENSYTSAPPLQLQDMLWGDPEPHTTHTVYPQQEVSFITKSLPNPSSRVKTRPKPSGFFRTKKSSARLPSEGK